MAENKAEKTFTERQVKIAENKAAKEAAEKSNAEIEELKRQLEEATENAKVAASIAANAEQESAAQTEIEELKNLLAEAEDKAAAAEMAAADAEAQMDAKIAAAVARAMAEMPQPVAAQILTQTVTQQPKVKILYLDDVIDNNTIELGKFGQISGSGTIRQFNYDDFIGEMQTGLMRYLLESRKFIIIDGLDDDERANLGVNYKEGEIIKNKGIYDQLISMSDEDAARIYQNLCPQHREFVASAFCEAKERGDNRINLGKVERLNRIFKEDNSGIKGQFDYLIEKMTSQ